MLLTNDQKFACSDSLKIFFSLSAVPMIIQISRKSAHVAQKCYFYQKGINKQS